ncbi:MAG: HDOD domain-containing protein, partial [Deltaproteobacteria bacterium]|nr:HDOD domain-containing protein [Deltaproteobacteria bacterium]
MSDDLLTEYQGRLLQITSLPALPTTLHEVNRIMESPDASTEQIAKVISYDQALASKVLRMVNSPIYGFPGRISSLQHALMLLGFNVIRGLIISTSVFDAMNAGMAGLWDHSLGCSLACSAIARATGRKNPEEYAVGGLLHDLGKAVCALQLPEAK